MRIKLLLFYLFISSIALPQEPIDMGAIVGTSYYMGDFNPSTQFYQPSPAAGFLFRYNVNELYSVRFSGIYGSLKGSHDNELFFLPGLTDGTASFQTQIIELESLLEINFMQFNTWSKRQSISPFVLLGFGGAYLNQTVIPHIPIGIGIKYSPAQRWTVGAEWRIHKTFYDEIDGYTNISIEPRSIIHNNDWFGIAGIFVTYRLVNHRAICPAYD